jgi:hypothetical protein
LEGRTARAAAQLNELGDWALAHVSDPSSPHRGWCGLRTDDGEHVAAYAPTLAQALVACAERARATLR